jgi:large subunit ribosomal protein L17
MKHHNSIRKFGRVRKQRVALLSSLANSLVIHGKIKTTEARAKEVRPFIEKLITKGRSGSLAARRLITARLGGNKLVTKKIVDELSPKYKDRKGGYTRITKLPTNRQGDASPLAQIEFV